MKKKEQIKFYCFKDLRKRILYKDIYFVLYLSFYQFANKKNSLIFKQSFVFNYPKEFVHFKYKQIEKYQTKKF